MLKPAFGTLAFAALFAGAAVGQTSTAPAAPDPTAPAAATGKVVEGVTVTGRRLPTKSCSSRDDACIAAVVAELKAHYPRELKTWCSQVQLRAAQNTMEFMEINLDRPHPNVGPYTPPPVAKTACAADKKP